MSDHQHIDIVFNDWQNEVQVRIGWLRAHYANWSPVTSTGTRHFHSDPHTDDACPFADNDVLPMEVQPVTIADLVGSVPTFSGDKSAVDYVRDMRDGGPV